MYSTNNSIIYYSKLWLTVMVGCILLSGQDLFAQSSLYSEKNSEYDIIANIDLDISATIMGTLSMSQIQDLNFGSVSSTTPGFVRIDPSGLDNFNTGLDGYFGWIQISGNASGSEPATQVQVRYPGHVLLTSGEHSMVYSLEVKGSTQSNPFGATSYTTPGQNGFVNIGLDATTGAHNLFIGGYLSPEGTSPTTPAPLVNQPVGIYTGSVNVTVNYL